MAEANAPKEAPPEVKPAGGGGKAIILYALVAINMAVVIGVAMMVNKWRQDEVHSSKGKIKSVIEGEKEAQEADHKKKEEEYVGQMIPLETFLVNLAGSRGNKLLKVNMEFEVEGAKIVEEIEKRKPQIRDLIIIHLSSKTLDQIQDAEGKNKMRNEIRDTVNSFLTKGRIRQVLFTEILYQ